MEFRKGCLCILLSAFLACSWIPLSPQSNGNALNEEHLPLPVGVWESKQPDGSVVGIDLASVPASVPDAVYPEGTSKPQGFRLQIGIFQRQHERIACGDENFFVTGWTGPGPENGSTAYADRKLEVNYRDRVSGS